MTLVFVDYVKKNFLLFFLPWDFMRRRIQFLSCAGIDNVTYDNSPSPLNSHSPRKRRSEVKLR